MKGGIGKLLLRSVIVSMVFALTAAGCAFAQSSVSFGWSTQINTTYGEDVFVTGVAVNQATGDIYATIAPEAATGAAAGGEIIKLNSAGTIIWDKGPALTDAGGTTRFNIQRRNPTGVSVDPLTGQVYVVAEAQDTSYNSFVIVLDSNGNWLRQFSTGMAAGQATGGRNVGGSAFGGAFSDDGQKYLIAGILEKLSGAGTSPALLGDALGSRYGGKLFMRKNNGTPGDASDDTWTATADLEDDGEFFSGYLDPRATAFDRTGRPCVGEFTEHLYDNCQCSSYVRQYSTSAPYQIDRAVITGQARGMDLDNDNNIWLAGDRDRADSADHSIANSVANVRCYSPNGIRLLSFRTDANGGSIVAAHCVAYDRTNGKVVVGGTTVLHSGIDARVEVYTPTLVMPATETFTGRVVDAVTGNPIPFANVGYRSSATPDPPGKIPRRPQNFFPAPFGLWERGRADASGNFSFTIMRTQHPDDEYGNPIEEAFPIVPVASADGYLSKRIYSYQIGDPAWPDHYRVLPQPIRLDPVATTSTLCIRTYGKEGYFDPVMEESGLFNILRPLQDVSTTVAVGGDTVAELGKHGTDALGWYTRFLSLQIDDRWMKAGSPAQTIYVTVEYWPDCVFSDGTDYTDPGTWDTIGLEADVVGSTDADRNQLVGQAYKTTTQDEWKTATFAISNAYFGNRGMKGGDLRVNNIVPPGVFSPYVDGYSMDWVKSVTVSKTPPEGYPVVATVGDAKAQGTGDVVLSNKTITAQWNGTTFYLEEPNRTSGIRVKLTDASPWVSTTLPSEIGRLANVQGTLGTDPNTGEAEIVATAYGVESAGACGALGMGGAVVDKNTGIDMTGLKVGVWGLVKSVSPGASFVINDGSEDVSVVIDPSLSITWPTNGDYVAVTGIATLTGSTPATSLRVVKPWSTVNVLIVNDVP